MSNRSRVCPFCRALNGADERRCLRCEKRLPGPLVTTVLDGFRSTFGTDFPVTKIYLGICLLVFVAVFIESGTKNPLASPPLSMALKWGAMAGALWGVSDVPVSFVEPWRYLSAMFLHLGLLHIVFNAMTLFSLGQATEQRLGSARFTIIFVLTGVLGYVASDAWNLASGHYAWPPTAGASGGLFGLGGALIGYLYARKDPAYKDILWQMAIFTIIMFVGGFSVNHAAHFGGFFSGIPLGYLFYKETRPWQRNVFFGWLAAALIVCSIASVLLCQRSPLWQERKRLEILHGQLAFRAGSRVI